MSRVSLPVSASILNELYWNQKLSSLAIAKRFSCDPATIRARIRSYGLRLRTRQEAYLYQPYTLPRQSRYPKRDFDGDNARKAYLIGFRLGDLTVNPSSNGPYSQTIEVKCRTTQPEQIRLFKRLFAGYGHFHQCTDRHGAVYLICYLNRSFEFLLPKRDLVEPWIRQNGVCATAFAAGYIDAEGSFHLTTTRTGLKKAVFALASQDRAILSWFHEWLQSVGVRCQPLKLSIRKGTPRQFTLNKDYWVMQVHRKDALLRLIQLLRPCVLHPKRRTDMARVIANIRERNTSPSLKFAPRQHRAWALRFNV
jgi:hypothetical protein